MTATTTEHPMTPAMPAPPVMPEPPTATAHELMASYHADPKPRPRKPREFAFICPSCGSTHVLVGPAPVFPATQRAPCGTVVRLVPGPPVSLPVALWRTHRQERMIAALYPALLRAMPKPVDLPTNTPQTSRISSLAAVPRSDLAKDVPTPPPPVDLLARLNVQ
jgi:hypothetical protein